MLLTSVTVSHVFVFYWRLGGSTIRELIFSNKYSDCDDLS